MVSGRTKRWLQIAGIAILAIVQSHAATHKVAKGETLSSIAQKYDVSVALIKNANNIRNADKISIGQKLAIPTAKTQTIEYRIKRGDSLSKIASKHGIEAKQLAQLNGIQNPNKIRVGRIIKIPSQSNHAHPLLPSHYQKSLEKISIKKGVWKNIVIHHSATKTGTPKGFDRMHRKQGMDNGLAYHFVIGNGRGMGDGSIHIGTRWKSQIQGGHVKSASLNRISIGICLVGNFEKTKPTEKQMERLEALIAYLLEKTEISSNRITTHTLIHPNHTLCPGKLFPAKSFKAKF